MINTWAEIANPDKATQRRLKAFNAIQIVAFIYGCVLWYMIFEVDINSPIIMPVVLSGLIFPLWIVVMIVELAINDLAPKKR